MMIRAKMMAGALVALFVAACDTEPPATERRIQVAGGDADTGRHTFRAYGCVACHEIPGVMGARGRTGPPLDKWSQRRFIAGSVPNTAEDLILFIQQPQAVKPGIAMPNMGVSAADARDMAAYLLTLR